MERKDLEDLRDKVPCGAILETDGWKLDAKESSKRAVKYRRGEGEIVIATRAGKGWFDPMSDAKGDVFGLSEHIGGFGFAEALERVGELVGFVASQPVWRKPIRDKPVSLATTRWNTRPRVKPGSATWVYLTQARGIPEANAGVNLNGGGRITTDPSISISPLRQQLETLSVSLAAMPVTGTVSIPTGQLGPVMINAVPNTRKIAVFNVNGTALLDNASVQQIDISLNGADAVVINVAGSNVKFRQGNLVGAFNTQSVYSKVIWNFKDAVNVHVDRPFVGTILAPKAQVLVNAQVKGGVVSRSINQQAAIVTPEFLAIAPFAPVSAKVDAAVVQIKSTANGLNSFDTALVTRFNIAPVAGINLSAASDDAAAPVTLGSSASADANGDALTFKWALLSKPAGSLASVTAQGTSAGITPDRRGMYIIQLTASDGKLASEPVTAVFTARNRVPVITSTAPAGGVTGAAYAYAAAGSDADGDGLTWSLVSGPAGMVVNPATGAVAWTPDAAGSFSAVIKAADGFGGEVTQFFSVTVIPGGNRFAPVLSPVANVTLHPGETVAFTLSAADADGDIVTFWSPSLPAGAGLNAASGAFTFTAGGTAGTIPVTFSATDGILYSSVSAFITVTPWPDTEPTRLSGRVLDAQDLAPIASATIRVGAQTAMTAPDGRFSFNPLDALDASASGPVSIFADGSTAVPASSAAGYGSATSSATAHRNGSNTLASPILLARRDGSAFQLTNVTDTLPPSLRSCRIQRADSSAGGAVSLSSLTLAAAEPLPGGTKISIWANNGGAGGYAIAGTASVAADGVTHSNITGSVPSGTNLVVAPISLTGKQSALQPKESYVPSLLGEGNLQTGFSLPSYMSVGQSRAASFLYNSVTANPRPIITADVTIPAGAALTATLAAELYVNGQKAPGMTVTRLDAAERPAAVLPTENADAIASVSVSFDASALPTGVYPYDLYVFAGHACGAGAAKITGQVFVSNRSRSPYGSGRKPTELQQLFPQPDGSIVIEEPNAASAISTRKSRWTCRPRRSFSTSLIPSVPMSATLIMTATRTSPSLRARPETFCSTKTPGRARASFRRRRLFMPARQEMILRATITIPTPMMWPSEISTATALPTSPQRIRAFLTCASGWAASAAFLKSRSFSTARR
jgi:Putative Ig domain